MNKNKIILRSFFAFVALIIVISAGPVYIVNEGEQAVVTRFGEIVESRTETGLYVKIPFLDVVKTYPTKILSLEGDQARIPTKENQFIIVDTTSRWRISDPVLFYQSFKTLDAAYNKLSDIIDSSTRTIITKNRLSEIVRSSNIINSKKEKSENTQLAGVEGEDSAEISCHASQYILNTVLELLISNGATLASPGEFTQRAYLNGKIDLSQAEAVADLISSTTKATHDIAISQLKGHFSTELHTLRDQLLHLTTLLELELDFSDHEELEFADRNELL